MIAKLAPPVRSGDASLSGYACAAAGVMANAAVPLPSAIATSKGALVAKASAALPCPPRDANNRASAAANVKDATPVAVAIKPPVPLVENAMVADAVRTGEESSSGKICASDTVNVRVLAPVVVTPPTMLAVGARLSAVTLRLLMPPAVLGSTQALGLKCPSGVALLAWNDW